MQLLFDVEVNQIVALLSTPLLTWQQRKEIVSIETLKIFIKEQVMHVNTRNIVRLPG